LFYLQETRDLEFLDKGEMINGMRFWLILDEKLQFFLHQHQTSHFLQDGALCHKAKIMMTWFQERPQIQLNAWPGNSPDLNPVDNGWAWMKKQLRNENPTRMEE
jgi:transposase